MVLVWEDGRAHYKPELLSAAEKAGSIEIESMPEPKVIPGKIPIRKVDMAKKLVYYEYQDAPEDDPARMLMRIKDLEARIAKLEK